MSKTREERRTALMAMLEGEVDKLLGWEETAERVTMSDIEREVLGARRRISERLAEAVIEGRVAKADLRVPRNEVSGQALHNKGKKTKSAKRGLG